MREKSLRSMQQPGVNVHALSVEVEDVELQFSEVTGDKLALNTEDKTNLVAALNEVNTKANELLTKSGNVENLETVNKDTLVNAINELNTNLKEFMRMLNEHVEQIEEGSEVV